jgi:phosphatidylserine synthase
MARRVRRVVDEADAVDDAEVAHSSVERAPWSPAQIVSLVVGAIFAIIGGITLANTGMNFNDLSANHETVAGMDQTAWLGIAELVVGLFLIGAGAIPGGGRATMTFFGVIVLGFGIVMLISNGEAWMTENLTTDDSAGWFFVIMGAILLVAAMVAPVIFGSDRRSVSRRSAVYER